MTNLKDNPNLKLSDKLEDTIEYLNSVTKSWQLEHSEGSIELYSYHDGVDWDTHYAIVVNGTIKVSLKDMSYEKAHSTYEVVVNCLS